ncbi:MAG: BatD family protein [Candidatus Zixiibacteriota bacterium]
MRGKSVDILTRAILAVMLILSMCAAAPSFAQNISFNASVDRTEVGLDDQIMLSVSVSGNVKSIPQPELPTLESFTVYSSGRSQSFSYTNGSISSSVIFNYVLVPKKTGKFTIGPARIELDGKTYQTNPIDINVLAQTNTQPPAPAAQPGTEKAEEKPQVGAKDLFIETVVDKKKTYVNEQVTLTFKFYQGVRLFNSPEYTPPSVTGFWSEDLPPRKQYYQVVNGKQYFVQELKTALFPTSTGKLTIGPAELKCTAEDLSQLPSRDPFAMFDRDLFSLFRQGKPQVLRSRPIEIEVLPLPEMGRPANFSETVGDYALDVKIDKTEVEVGQPVTLKARISGSGNVKSVGKPTIPELPDFRTYSSGSSENVSKDNYLVQGVKTYEEVLIPKKTGNYTISPIELSFFNPKTKTYQTLRSQPIVLTVRPSSQASQGEIAQLSKQEIGRAVKDIRYIKLSTGELKNQGSHLYRNPLFLFFQLIPLLAFALSWRYQKERERLSSDIGYARQRRAHKSAKKRLERAGKLIFSANSKEFYGEVGRALLQYTGDKLNLSAHGLTKDRIESELSARGFGRDQVENLMKLLDSCDFARFAPGSSTPEEMKRFLGLAEEAIVNLEE